MLISLFKVRVIHVGNHGLIARMSDPRLMTGLGWVLEDKDQEAQ